SGAGQLTALLGQAGGVCPANRVLDRGGVMPPKGGRHHDPRQAARCAERATVAAVDRGVADPSAERAGPLRPARAFPGEPLCLAAGTAAAGSAAAPALG